MDAMTRSLRARLAAAGSRSGFVVVLGLMLLLASTLVSASDEPVAEARAAIDRDDYPAAILVLEQRLAEFPGDEEARYLLARTLAWSRRWDAAMAEYDLLLDQSPDNADLLAAGAQLYSLYGSTFARDPDRARERREQDRVLLLVEPEGLSRAEARQLDTAVAQRPALCISELHYEQAFPVG